MAAAASVPLKERATVFENYSQCFMGQLDNERLGVCEIWNLCDAKVLRFTQIPGRSTGGQIQLDSPLHTHINTRFKTRQLFMQRL